MRMLGLSESVVSGLIREVTEQPEILDAVGILDRFSRVAWGVIAEPGDGVAGQLVGALGAHAALSPLVAGLGVAGLSSALAGAGATVDADQLKQAVARWQPRLRSDLVTLGARQAARYAARLLVPGDEAWPSGVDDLGHHAPHALWVRGRTSLVGDADGALALVGARAATGYGEHVTVEASAGLVDRGYGIVSGAAYGIDGVAHRAALASDGDTIAVLAGGLDRFYPSGHEELLTRIADRGAIVSEVPCGSAPTRWRFLQRNRIIAAMSAATVVIEAGWRSGSLNTAGHAAALARPLGAVPGPVTSSASAGCHRLLREYGAVCVTTADEMAELAPRARRGGTGDATMTTASDAQPRSGPVGGPDPEGVRVRVLDALSARSPRTVDRIAADSGLAPDAVRAQLGSLDAEGLARDAGTGWVRARVGGPR